MLRGAATRSAPRTCSSACAHSLSQPRSQERPTQQPELSLLIERRSAWARSSAPKFHAAERAAREIRESSAGRARAAFARCVNETEQRACAMFGAAGPRSSPRHTRGPSRRGRASSPAARRSTRRVRRGRARDERARSVARGTRASAPGLGPRSRYRSARTAAVHATEVLATTKASATVERRTRIVQRGHRPAPKVPVSRRCRATRPCRGPSGARRSRAPALRSGHRRRRRHGSRRAWSRRSRRP